MLLGATEGEKSRPLVTSAPKTPPIFNIPGITSPAPVARTEYVTLPSAAPVSEDIPEIVVTGKRIPWYAWALAGVVGFAVVDSLLGRKG